MSGRTHDEEALRREIDELREANARLRASLEATQVGLWERDLVTGAATHSPRYAQILGYAEPPPDWSLERGLQHVHPADRPWVHQGFRNAIASGTPFEGECRIVRVDGEERWVWWRGAPEMQDGEAVRIGGVVIDVTERKRTEQRLRTSAERLSFMLEVTDVGQFDVELSTGLTERSGRHARIFGYESNDSPWSLESFLRHVVPADRDDIARRVRSAMAAGGEMEFECRIQRRDGAQRWIWVRAAIPPPTAGARHLSGIVMDITERKGLEEALRRSEREFRQLADAMPAIVFTATPEGYTDYYNERWYEFTGQPRGSSGDASFVPILHPDDVQRCLDTWYESVRSGRMYQIEYRFRDQRTGQYRWFLGRALPARDERGAITRWFGTCTDIDDQKRAEQALKEADRRKDEFLATLAHELRNPLAPLRTGLSLLKQSGDSAQAFGRARGMMERQIGTMVRLIDDLLDVSRVSRGQIELRREALDLRDTIQAAAETCQALVAEMRHRLVLDLPDRPLRVMGDRTRLTQVFANLLDNAAKYTGPGGDLRVTAYAQGNEACVQVADNGCGIPPQMLDRVFDMFTQVNRTLDRARGGLGIGLSIVRRLVEMHGGRIEVHSEGLGRGSTFVAHLPLSVAPAELEPLAPAAPMAGRVRALRVLVADDNVDAAISLKMLIELSGHEVRVAHDGIEAVNLAESFDPELVLLDLGMPGMDGHAVCRRLRESGRHRGVTIVALTGWGQASDRVRSQEAGFDKHLVKPVDPAVLEPLIAEIAAKQG